MENKRKSGSAPDKLTIALICEFLLVALLTIIAIWATGRIEIILVGLLIAASIYLLLIIQRKKYERDLETVTKMIEGLISGGEPMQISEGDDIIKSKIQHQLTKLNGIVKAYGEKAEKDKTEIRNLIVEIAHQLRTPLSNIQTYTELLKDNGITEAEKEKYIAAIQESEAGLSFLIESFIKMSRLENKIIQIRKTETDLPGTIAKAVDKAKPSADEKKISLNIDLDAGILVLHDKNWLEEAVFNIIDNAIKYSPSESSIEIRLMVNEMFAQIEIADHGMGIKKKEQNEIFKRFYRGSNVTDQQGFGIGLYITREIVHAHDGFMRVKSRDDGASFSIYLPFAEK